MSNITAAIISMDGLACRALPATVMGILHSTVPVKRIVILNTSGIPFSTSPMWKGLIKFFDIEVYDVPNVSEMSSRYDVLGYVTGPCWMLDDDCVPAPDCLEKLVNNSFGIRGVQGSKIDMVRLNQYGDNDWNVTNQYKPIVRTVYWLDGCNMLVDAQEYRHCIADVMGIQEDPKTFAGDVAPSALYASRHGAVAVGDAVVFHLPDKPARWDKGMSGSDAITYKVLSKLLTPPEFIRFQLSIARREA